MYLWSKRHGCRCRSACLPTSKTASPRSTLTGRSKTFYAVEAIVEHIDDLEDAHLSAEVLARVRAGTEARIPSSDLLGDYGLAR